MFNYKIKFTRKKEAAEITNEKACELIDDYYNTLSNNGQAICGFEIYSDKDSIIFAIVLPMEDSLSDNYSSTYVKERYNKLKDIFDIEIIREGINIEYHTSCECIKPSWYFLYNEGNLGESPLVCGDCHKPVPLYKIPYISKEKDHYPVLSWWRAKNAMDSLWYHGLWDRFTYGENVLPKSKLNREGRKLCKELEKSLKVPVYYFIYYFCEEDDDEDMITPKGLPHQIPKVCPLCGGEWIDDSEFCKCEKCRLITDSPAWKGNRNLM